MSGRLRLALLDVGHGNAAVLYASKEAIIFDAPPGSVLLKFLRSRGIARVRSLILSHADTDHIGGVDLLIGSGIKVDYIWVCDDQTNSNRAYRRLRQVFADARANGDRRLSRRHPDVDQEPIEWGGLGVEWLAPNPEDRMGGGDRNSLSVVARVTYGGRGVVLFPGDLDMEGYRRLSQESDWSSDWLVVPHHGGRTGVTANEGKLVEELLNRTAARDVFFSFDRNRFGLPRAEVVAAVSGRAEVQCSQLSLHCATQLPTERDRRGPLAAGARRSPIQCCSGTVILELSDSGVSWPGSVRHRDFVSNLEGRMCSAFGDQEEPRSD